jgi:hypothetical protein
MGGGLHIGWGRLGPDGMVVWMIQEMERVVEEVQELPVQVAGLQELEQGVADARAWLVRVRTTLGMVHLYEYRTSVALLSDLLASTSIPCAECECLFGRV